MNAGTALAGVMWWLQVIEHSSPGSVLPGHPNLWVRQAAMTYVLGMQSFYQRCV